MTRFTLLLGCFVTLMPAAGVAQTADATGQVLGRCLVMKSTGADRLVVARWLEGVLASAPQAADMVMLSAAKKSAADQAMAKVFTRLLTVDCAAESKAVFALPANKDQGFRIAGETLGRVAMGELMTDRKTAEALSAYTKYLDPAAFKKVIAAP